MQCRIGEAAARADREDDRHRPRGREQESVRRIDGVHAAKIVKHATRQNEDGFFERHWWLL